MSVLSVKQISAGRSGSGKSDYNRSYKVTFCVIVSDPYDAACTIGQSPLLPGRYSRYVGFENTDDYAALCTGLELSPDDEWQTWTATATFETNWQQDQHQHEDPSEIPLERWVEVEFEKRSVTKEWDGTDIRNSAGQLLRGLERDDAVGVYCCERWEKGLNSHIKLLNNTVNSQPIFDLDVREGLLRITVGKPEYRNGVQFYKHLYRIRVNPDKWDVEPADRGTQVVGADGQLHVPTDNINQPYDDEVNLDGNGRILARGKPLVYLPAKQLYKPASWAPLNF